MQCNACCKLQCEKILDGVTPTLSPCGEEWWPSDRLDEGGSLRIEQVQFQVDKFQQLSTIQGLICIVLDVGVPKLVSAFRIIKGPHLRGES